MTALPIVAIVGRPNVGKSTLFNRIVGRRRSIVADQPGVTRDRIYAEAELRGERVDRPVVLIDTGGFEPKSSDPIMQRMLDQTALAMDEADVVVFVVDGRAGLLPEDHEIARSLRKGGKKTIVAVNKIDGDRHEALSAEFHALGLEQIWSVSAAHGRGIADLQEQVVELLPYVETPPPPEPDFETWEPEDAETEADSEAEAATQVDKGPIRVAVIGRPNVGKSSLINRLLGEDRHLVSNIAGTTVDSVDSLVQRDGQEYLFIDTAGIRRKRSIAMRIEKFSVFAALRGLERSDVALLLLDATQPVAEQDAKVAAFAYQKGRAVILVVSKWDAKKGEEKLADHREQIRQQLKHLTYAPVVFTSSLSGYGLDRLFPMIRDVHEQHKKRITTGELNRFVERVMDHKPPPSKKGKRARIYYITQIGAQPPRFLVSCNNPELIHFSYRRFLVNELRKEYGFKGVPLLVGYRSRTKKNDRKKKKKKRR